MKAIAQCVAVCISLACISSDLMPVAKAQSHSVLPAVDSDVVQKDFRDDTAFHQDVDFGVESEQPERSHQTSGASDRDSKQTQSAAQNTFSQSSDTRSSLAEPSSFSGYEDPAKKYHFIGIRARGAYVPKFMFSLFSADGGKDIIFPSVGLEYACRSNRFEWVPWLVYSSYAMGDVALKAKSDSDDAYEIISSSMKSVSVGVDVLWSFKIVDKGLSFVLGGGIGAGIVFGNLYRTQAYPKDGPSSDIGGYAKCPGAGQAHSYCGNDNDHYNGYKEPSWFNGGLKPAIFPWVAVPQIGLRYKPHRRFVVRFDTGLSIPGPLFFGLAAQYGL